MYICYLKAHNRNYDHNTILEAGSRIRLIGDPGSGKSSIAKRLVRDECHRALSGGNRRFPVLIELRRISIPGNVADEKLGDWLFSQLNRRVKTYAVYEIDKCFDIFAKTSGLHIVLDGLDEVASHSYPRVRIAINLLSEKLSKLGDKNIVVITLRTQFHQQVRNDFPEFPVVLSLKRFSAADIYTFLTKWPFETSQRRANIVRIYTNLGDQPALREMCTNPLVLSMYVAQDQAKGSPNTPETRTAFYSEVVDELMINRRAAQLGQVQQHVLLREQRQRIFGRIAFDHLVKGSEATNRIAWKDGVDVVRAVTKKSVSEAEHFLRDLSKETGLITEERPAETFRFIHLTFCEFFAGFEAVEHRKDGWSELIKAFRDFSQADISKARLVEVIPFACALMPAHSKSDAIVEVHDELANKYVLALSFLETKLYNHPLWRKFKDNYQEELISSSEANWGLEWLAKVHTFLVVCSDAERARNITPLEAGEATEEVAPFFQEFARRSQKPISILIQSFAEQDAAAAFRVADLCGINVLSDAPELIIQNVNQPAFLAMALKIAEQKPDQTNLWASLLCEAGLRSPSAADQIIRAERLIHVPAENKNMPPAYWYISKIASGNLYGDCFAIVLKV
jgi:GTPase SAR1 family protein